MTATASSIRGVFQGKFLAAVAIAFLVQVALLFWLSDRRNLTPARPAKAPAFRWGDLRPAAQAEIEDPTLFVLPHQQGFSGDAWMKIPAIEFPGRTWSEGEKLQWLPTPVETLGQEFARYMERSPIAPFRNLVAVEPALTLPRLPPAKEVARPSTLRIQGDLAGRSLVFTPPLRSWSSLELTNVAFLSNSVVQVVVDERGNVFSAVPLGAGSGSAEANKEALRVANQLRFAPTEIQGPKRPIGAAPDLTVGEVIFEWQWLPATNAAASQT